MTDIRRVSIVPNELLNKRIVYAINKAITQDIPQEMRENRLETNNRFIYATGDYINENLRRYVVNDEVDLISFNRYAWEGRIIVDKKNKVTYTVSTHRNLNTIITKNRNQPHYLMPILYVENGDCVGTPRQMTLGDVYPSFQMNSFDSEVLEEDYDNIMKGNINKSDGYKHYVVAYTAEHHVVVDVELLLLDKEFAIVDRLSLIEYVTPDFGSMMESQYIGEDQKKETEQEAKPSLIKLKPSVNSTFGS